MERAADSKSEFFDGEVFAMAGNSKEHSIITVNLIPKAECFWTLL